MVSFPRVIAINEKCLEFGICVNRFKRKLYNTNLQIANIRHL